LAFGLLLVPARVDAQPAARAPTVGILVPGPATGPIQERSRKAFERGLSELGWRPGETVRIEYRYADGSADRLEELARLLVRQGVDVIVARATSSIRAAKQATASIPVVMSASGGDPVLLGFVKSLARPGGNVTGLTLLNEDLLIKQLEMLREAVPALSRAAVLGSAANAVAAKGREDLESAARRLGVQLHYLDVRGPEEIDSAFNEMARLRIGGILVRADPFVLEPNEKRVVSLAREHRLPAIYWLERYPRAGGLMSYGADLIEVHRRSAYYVDRILRGARPADLPVEEPTVFALVVNLKAARALGLAIPQSLLLRAEQVIE
jgi:putative ABC transport system substrate-binding protein